jgi:hypothetical protein
MKAVCQTCGTTEYNTKEALLQKGWAIQGENARCPACAGGGLKNWMPRDRPVSRKGVEFGGVVVF